MKVTAIEEFREIESMKLDELVGSIQTFELSMKDRTEKKNKSIAFVSNTDEESESDKEADEDISEALVLLGKQFNKILRRTRPRTNVKHIQPDISKQENMSRKPRTEDRNIQGRGVQRHECEGYGHIKAECPTYLKKQKKCLNVISWSDEESESDNEATKSVNAMTGKCESDSDSDEDVSYNKHAATYKELCIKSGELCKTNEEQRKTIAQLEKEKQVHLSTIANLENEASMIKSQFESMDKQLRLLNNGTDRKHGQMFPHPAPHQRRSRSCQHHGPHQRPPRYESWRCYYCGKYGLIKAQCYKLHGYRYKGRQVSPPPKKAEKKKFWKTKSNVEIKALIAHTSFKVSSKEDWYFDSGCSRHMTGEKKYLNEINPYTISFVTFGDGAKGEIKGIGNLINKGLPKLNDVLLVKGLTPNLISISQLCDQGLKVNFTKNECLITNDKNTVIMKGARSKDNCYLWIPQETAHTSITNLLSKEDEVRLWHQKLGHLHLKGMKRIIAEDAIRGIPKLSIEEGSICGECQVEAIWDCDSFKCPGPDGINIGLFTDFWDLTKIDLLKKNSEFHRHGTPTKGLNSTFIALIPKVDSPQKVADFRPIALVNSVYKILAKVLANRLRRVIGNVVAHSQSAFVKDRQILDGILIANEVVDDAKRNRKDLLMFKVDFEKAYDSVDWGYLEKVMFKMNFPATWCRWIMECVTTATASVLVNGSPTDEFGLERGLRQGNPLSPFLFLLAAEGLNVMMNSLVSRQLSMPYGIGVHNEVLISHLQFADDTLLIGEKSWANVRALKSVLLLFESVSGLKVNFHKSMLFGINVNDSWLHEAVVVMRCNYGRLPFLYLGLPIGGDSRKLRFWDPVVSRIRKRLSGWKCKNLSFGGRLILLKFVMSSVPVYFLSFFKAPSGIISSLESMFSHFFWGGCEENRKTSWIKWDSICLNKANGGLGVRRLKEFNFSLLGKWVWRCLEEKDSLWCKVLQAKYGQEGGRLRFGEGVGSHWWRSMNDVRVGAGLGDAQWLLDNITRKVGDGCETRFWTDPWLSDCSLQRSFGRLFDLTVDKNVSVADMFAAGWDLGGEAWKWRRRLYAWEEELVVEGVGRLANVVLQVGARDIWVHLAKGCSLEGDDLYLAVILEQTSY
ncbi:hypothetical protein TSUD_56250 [Trifolium subterraneum]|uniref:Reverse transcriptase domain-containing protein n=1 Tax=Trifolium subterraneum TaxID=3900 RepID=A0A2Z6NAM5_TRISU|nr:hypothetical protein TSUD_56250 [Trifolium subterraneum]